MRIDLGKWRPNIGAGIRVVMATIFAADMVHEIGLHITAGNARQGGSGPRQPGRDSEGACGRSDTQGASRHSIFLLREVFGPTVWWRSYTINVAEARRFVADERVN